MHRRTHALASLAGSVFLLMLASRVQAASISFQLSSTALTAPSGGTVTFDGTVTNNSGTDLKARDFFFNFFGYDPTSVTPIQDLGVSTDFPIGNGTTSAEVALFDVTLGLVPAGSSFPIQIQLEDAQGDLSAIQTATVSASPIPEPGTVPLLGAGLSGILAVWRRRKRSAC